jgi:long-chain acyl-CoA synthetase
MLMKIDYSSNTVLKAWQDWNGAIDCGYTNQIWYADDLRKITSDYSTQLVNAGLKPGNTVALILSNTIAFPVSFISLLKVGCNLLLLHGSTPYEEIVNYSKVMNINWLCHDYLPDISHLENQTSSQFTELSIENIKITIKKTDFSTSKTQNYQGVVFHPTSGTFGKPSICIRDQQVAIAEAVNYTSSISCYKNSRIVITTPLSHAFAYGFGLMSTLISNSTMVIDPVFNPKRLLLREQQKGSDILIVVPPMLHSLLHFKQMNSQYSLPKVVFYAGTRCDSQLKQEFESNYNVTLYTIYGTTETGAISTNYDEKGSNLSAGSALNNAEIKIINQEKYQDIGENTGEIMIRSSSMMNKYLTDKSDRNFTDFYPTGDIGTLDDQNRLFLVGRIKDIVNVDGMKVDPVEVENVLLSYQLITDAVVYPGASSNHSEILVATICGDITKQDLEEIKKYCYTKLLKHKVPSIFYIREKLPRTPSGKCLKTQLPNYFNN